MSRIALSDATGYHVGALARGQEMSFRIIRSGTPTGVAPTSRMEVSRLMVPSLSLSARELEVLRWVQDGKGTWEISLILSISERTVKFHVANVMRKLDATTWAHAVAIAMERRLLQVG